MGVLDEQGIGLERVAVGLMVTLINNLNDELQVLEARYAASDEALDDLRGRPYVPVTLEPVAPGSFFLGDDPSLIDDNTPLDTYPAVTVNAVSVSPSDDDDGDHHEALSDRVYAELFVKASPSEGSEVVFKRAARTAEAIHNVVARDRTLGGVVYEAVGTPSAILSEAFPRPENPAEGAGEDWFWKAARVDYEATKYAPYE